MNLHQVGQWTNDNFSAEQKKIELYMGLIRKNVKALHTFPLSPTLTKELDGFLKLYDDLDTEYQAGIKDQKAWAGKIIKCGTILVTSCKKLNPSAPTPSFPKE